MPTNERAIKITAPYDQIDYITAAPRSHSNQQYLLLALDALLQPDSPSNSLNPGIWDVGPSDWRATHVSALLELESASLRTYDPQTMLIVAEHAGLWLQESQFGQRDRERSCYGWDYDLRDNQAKFIAARAKRRGMGQRAERQLWKYRTWSCRRMVQRKDWHASKEPIPSYYRAEYAYEPRPGFTFQAALTEQRRLGELSEKQAHDEAPKRRKLLGKPSNRPMRRFTTSLPQRVREPLLAQVQAHAGDPTLARFGAWLWMWAHSSQPNHEVPMNVACKLRAFVAREHWLDVRDRYLHAHPSPSRFHLLDPRDPILGPIPEQQTLHTYLTATK